MGNNTYRAVLLSILLVVSCICASCDLFGGKKIPVSTKLVSSTLAEMPEGYEFRLAASELSADCAEYDACMTPDTVFGKVYYAGIMVGMDTGYSLGPIIGDVIDPSPTTSFKQSELLDFDLYTQLDIEGSIQCCEGSPYPSDDNAYVRAVEILFGYVDTTFTLEEAAVHADIAGTHVIRTVYGDVDDTELQKGDVLYRRSLDEDFKWCTETEGCIHTSRPADPIQNDDIADYTGTPDGLGNQVIPSFSAELAQGHDPVQLTESAILGNSWQFVIDFDMTSGVAFTLHPSKINTIAELVTSFKLAAEPGHQDIGFTVTLTATTGDNQTTPTTVPAETTSTTTAEATTSTTSAESTTTTTQPASTTTTAPPETTTTTSESPSTTTSIPCPDETKTGLHWHNPYPDGYTYNSIFFTDTLNGWKVGTSGVVSHTTDGGTTWELIQMDTHLSLNSVYFADALHGWIGGPSGFIYHTTDGGTTWEEQSFGVYNTVLQMAFPDQNNGWLLVSYNQLFHTTDGGSTWTEQNITDFDTDINCISFIDTQTGWAAGDGQGVFQTTDGGNTWNLLYIGDLDDNINSIHFVDSSNGWAVGKTIHPSYGFRGFILHTSDGGTTWEKQDDGKQSVLEKVFFADTQTGCAVGNWGTLLYTTDGGNTWLDGTSDLYKQFLHDVFFIDPQHGWTAGSSSAANLRTTDGGKNWQSLYTTLSSKHFYSTWFINENTGFIGGEKTLLHTTDGGCSWENLEVEGDYDNFRHLTFIDDNSGWMVGAPDSVLHTTDGGVTWEEQYNQEHYIRSMTFVDAQNGWMATKENAVLKTIDGGTTWTKVLEDPIGIDSSEPYDPFVEYETIEPRHLFFTDNATGWLVGSDFKKIGDGSITKIMHTSDGGTTWEVQFENVANHWSDSYRLTRLFFLDGSTGWASGSGGKMLHTTDGGATWTHIETDIYGGILNDLYFLDTSNGWAIQDPGKILKTTDGGATWIQQNKGGDSSLFDLFFITPQNIWIAGSHGMILHYRE